MKMASSEGSDVLHVGIDIGSTTVKLVALAMNDGRDSSSGKQEGCPVNFVYSKYSKHFSDIKAAVNIIVKDAFDAIKDRECTFSITGSGGMGVATALGVPFVQEVIACTEAIETITPSTNVAIELGGEDAKISFFGKVLEQRMNGTCAGGTGSFIDHMAVLLKTDSNGLNELAKNYKVIYPIASRCGVFAKTDIQPLLNEGALKEDIAVSVLQAVVNQTISGLACGKPIRGKVALLGGPLFFMSELRKRFIETLHIAQEDVIFPDNAHYFVAVGAALSSRPSKPLLFSELVERLPSVFSLPRESRLLPAMFVTDDDYDEFVARHDSHKAPRADLATFNGRCYIGIDSGSTTTKLVIIDEWARIVHSFYGSNQGSPLATTMSALSEAYRLFPKLVVLNAASTGYGEGLIKAALHVDIGEIETIAHYKAAEFFLPHVDFVLDIGGQDMKSMRTRHGAIDSIMLNEACSSGCGSFITTFATSLNMDITAFAAAGVRSKAPVDLGTRCTVFMNSRVKQAQKEGASVEDISGGIAISIVKNALFKVIRMRSPEEMGERIVVQGGTFLNDSVLRAFETLCGHNVVRPDIAGIMGAFGAALIARERRVPGSISTILDPEGLRALSTNSTVQRCGRCTNNCLLTVNRFSDGGHFISGNRCERGAVPPGSKAPALQQEVPNIYAWKNQRLFQHYKPLATAPRGDIGVPRVLNMYEDYPLWFTVLTALGFRVLVSAPSSNRTYELGMETIPSDTVCYPAKLAHGHIQSLVDRKIKTIFYPCIVFNTKEDEHSGNTYNCPVVGSYAEVIKYNMHIPDGVRLLAPFLPLDDPNRMAFRLFEELQLLFPDLTQQEVKTAVQAGYRELRQYKSEVRKAGEDALQKMRELKLNGIVLLGRPYHVDPEINHGIPDTIISNKFAVFSEDCIAHLGRAIPFAKRPLRIVDQWVYHSRLYSASRFVAEQPDLDVLQLVSFGCGLDALTMDQVKETVERYNKIYTSIKIDEISNLGAARIRIRSLVAIIRERSTPSLLRPPSVSPTPPPALLAQEMSAELASPPSPLALATPVAIPASTTPPLLMEPADAVVVKEEPELPPPPPLVTLDMLETHFGLGPQFSPFHMDLCIEAFKMCGYPRLGYLPHVTKECIEEGLKYVHNDACFPAICVVGQIVHALKYGRYDPNRLVLFLVQTGGCCRATNYISFLRKALHDIGMPNIPVFALNAYGMDSHPAWRPNLRMPFRALCALIYGDLFMTMVQRIRPYELVKGSTEALHKRCMTMALKQLVHCNRREFANTVSEIVQLFDELPIDEVRRPRVGIVGEIMVKLAADANNHLVDFLEAEGTEAVTHDMGDFFLYCCYDHVTRNEVLSGTRGAKWVSEALIEIIEYLRGYVREAFSHSKRFAPQERIEELAELAERYGVSLCNQAGEGWFLTAEMLSLLRRGVPNILCLQPFACLPNHVTGRGMMRLVREKFPHANIAAIDYDPGASEINQLNRVKLMLAIAKKNHARMMHDNSKARSTSPLPNLQDDLEDLFSNEDAPSGCRLRKHVAAKRDETGTPAGDKPVAEGHLETARELAERACSACSSSSGCSLQKKLTCGACGTEDAEEHDVCAHGAVPERLLEHHFKRAHGNKYLRGRICHFLFGALMDAIYYGELLFPSYSYDSVSPADHNAKVWRARVRLVVGVSLFLLTTTALFVHWLLHKVGW